MDGFQIRQLAVVRVNADAEEEPGVAAIYDLQRAELNKIRLVLLVAGGDEAVNLLLGNGREGEGG